MNKQILVNTLMQYSSFLKTYSTVLEEKKEPQNYEVLLEFPEGHRTNFLVEETKDETKLFYTQEFAEKQFHFTRHLETIFHNESEQFIQILESLKRDSHPCVSRSYMVVGNDREELMHGIYQSHDWSRRTRMADPLLFTTTDIVPIYQNGIQLPVFDRQLEEEKKYLLKEEQRVKEKLCSSSLYRR